MNHSNPFILIIYHWRHLTPLQSEHVIDQKFVCTCCVITIASSFTSMWITWGSSQKVARLPLPWSLKKRMNLQIFPFSPASSLPQRSPSIFISLPLSVFALLVHQVLCFDIHVAAWLRCKRDSCEVLGHLLLLLFPFFLSWFFLSLLLRLYKCLCPQDMFFFCKFESHNNQQF